MSNATGPGNQIPLGVVIVNYRTPDITINCLRSLEGEMRKLPGSRVVVTDNASGDDSIEKIKAAIETEAWDEWVSLIPLDRNGGFAYGVNQGIKRVAQAKYVLILNSDAIVNPGCFSYCYTVMEQDPTIGILSCLLLNSDGTVQNVARKFPTPIGQIVSTLGLPWKLPNLFQWADIEDLTWDRKTTKREVDWLGGAFMMVPGELIQKIGGLDEDFFFYGEDVEFCHRVWKAGYRCYYDPTVSVTHYGGKSSDPSRLSSFRKNLFMWKARYLVQEKCYGRPSALVLRAVDTAACGLRVALLQLMGKQDDVKYKSLAQTFAILLGKEER